MTTAHQTLWHLLAQLEQAMVEADIWSDLQPDAQALQSAQPFCVDTLAFEQWVQFIMVPRFQAMIQTQVPLPDNCQIAPMAEVAWSDVRYTKVIAHLRAIDQLLSGE